jgi:redox-sensing transcriptional repressor
LEQIPAATRERLLQLMRILEGAGDESLSSVRIEELTGWSSHTVRRDISYLESFTGGPTADGSAGQTRLGSVNGYAPACLVPLIRRALSLDKRRRYCVVGLGRLGSSCLNMQDPPGDSPGFELTAGFDISVNRVEILKSPAPLYPAYKMGEVITRFGIEIALLCVPAEAAQTAADKLAAAGIRGIINFAPVALVLPSQVAVRNVYLEEELRALAIRM